MGGELKIEADLLPHGLLTWRATGHYDVIKNQILLVTQGPTTAVRQNVGKGTSVGTDLELRSRVGDQLDVSVRYAFADSIVTSFPGNLSREGLRLPNVSRHQVTVSITIDRVAVAQLTVQARYLSRQ